MIIKKKALDGVNEITEDTETGETTITLVHPFRARFNLYDGEECIASYENDKEFIKDYKRMKQENENLRETIKNDDLTINKLCANNKHYKHIIDELEKWLEEKLKEMQLIIDDVDISFEVDYERIDEARNCKIAYNTALNKLQELKGDKE